MPLETGTFITDLVPSNPASGDSAREGDDHLRLIKSALLATLPHLGGAVTLTHDQINALPGLVASFSALATQNSLGAYNRAATEATAALGVEADIRSQTDISITNALNDERTGRYQSDNALSDRINAEAVARATQDQNLLNNFPNYMALGSISLLPTGGPGSGTFCITIPTSRSGSAIKIACGYVGLDGANNQAWAYGTQFANIVSIIASSSTPGIVVTAQPFNGNSGRAWAYDTYGNITPGAGFYFIVIGNV